MTLIPDLFSVLMILTFLLSLMYTAFPGFRRPDIFFPFQSFYLFLIISLFLIMPSSGMPVTLRFSTGSDISLILILTPSRLFFYTIVYLFIIFQEFIRYKKHRGDSYIIPFFFFSLILFSGNQITFITGLFLFFLAGLLYLLYRRPGLTDILDSKRPFIRLPQKEDRFSEKIINVLPAVSGVLISLFLIACLVLIMIQVGVI